MNKGFQVLKINHPVQTESQSLWKIGLDLANCASTGQHCMDVEMLHENEITVCFAVVEEIFYM